MSFFSYIIRGVHYFKDRDQVPKEFVAVQVLEEHHVPQVQHGLVLQKQDQTDVTHIHAGRRGTIAKTRVCWENSLMPCSC